MAITTQSRTHVLKAIQALIDAENLLSAVGDLEGEQKFKLLSCRCEDLAKEVVKELCLHV